MKLRKNILVKNVGSTCLCFSYFYSSFCLSFFFYLFMSLYISVHKSLSVFSLFIPLFVPLSFCLSFLSHSVSFMSISVSFSVFLFYFSLTISLWPFPFIPSFSLNISLSFLSSKNDVYRQRHMFLKFCFSTISVKSFLEENKNIYASIILWSCTNKTICKITVFNKRTLSFYYTNQ